MATIIFVLFPLFGIPRCNGVCVPLLPPKNAFHKYLRRPLRCRPVFCMIIVEYRSGRSDMTALLHPGKMPDGDMAGQGGICVTIWVPYETRSGRSKWIC